MESSNFNRIVYFDYLRVVATFAVIILHISAQNWTTTDVTGFAWQIFNLYDSIVRWGVPIFVMISGALFLNKEIPIKKIYTKYIFRMLISFVVWSAIYALFSNGGIPQRVFLIISGHFHMWFIPMIVGLYICIPFIKSIVKNEFLIKYYLFLSFVFTFIIPEIVTLTNDFAGEKVIKVISTLNWHVSNMEINIFLGYTGYFILGYYLNMIDLNKKQRIIIYILGILGFALTIGLDSVVAIKTQQSCSNYYGNLTVNVLFESVAIFTLFKYKKCYLKKLQPFVLKLSKYSFGAYLVHALLIEQLSIRWGVNTLLFNPALSVIFIGIIVFICSFLISGALHKIPVINKYIV